MNTKLTTEEKNWLKEWKDENGTPDVELAADDLIEILWLEYFRHNRSLHETNEMVHRLTN